MTSNVAGGLALERPTTGAFASVEVEDQQLCWNPWAPPLLLNGRAAAIRDVLDGADLAETANLLAEMEGRAVPEVLGELRSVVRSLAVHGLLAESPPWRRPTPAVLQHELTPCDVERLQLGDASVFDIDLGTRRITVSIADQALADRLRSALPFQVLPATEPLSQAAHELAITSAPSERDFHHLYGRSGRIYARSLDPDDVLRAFVTNLWTLQWADAMSTDLVWLDALALVRHEEATLLPGHVRRLWQTMARRLARAGYRMVESVQIGIDPRSGRVVLPPPPPPPHLGILEALHIDPPQHEPDEQLAVAGVHDLVNPVDLQGLQTSGHDIHRLPVPLLTYRLALLAHRGVADTHPDPELDHPRAEAILTAVADLARQPQITASVHGDPRVLLASLCSRPPVRS